jgi:hypothetical protein
VLVEPEVVRKQDESTKALLHERLGGERFEAGFAEGAEMGIERSIEFALQTTD